MLIAGEGRLSTSVPCPRASASAACTRARVGWTSSRLGTRTASLSSCTRRQQRPMGQSTATLSIRDHLRRAQFLEGLTESALHQLSRLVSPVSYECDAILFEEGSPRRFLAILGSGAVAIEKTVQGRPVRLVTLGAGEALGEGLLLDNSPHGTSARAVQRTDAFVLTADQVTEMLKEYPALYAALVARAARAISQRLAATDATLVGHGRTLGFTGSRTRVEHDLL